MINSSQTFIFWPGSIELENKPFHLSIARELTSVFSSFNGYLAYKLTNLGRSEDDQVPSFLIITKEHGVIVLDVIEEKLLNIVEQDGHEFWKLNDNQHILSRAYEVQLYEEEIRSRLRNEPAFYDRKKRDVNVPITSFLLFCTNSDNELKDNWELIAGYGANVLTLENYSTVILKSLPEYDSNQDQLDKVISLIEGTYIYQTKSEFKSEEPPKSINDFIQLSLKTTFKQDDAQRAISMQLPDGPQRIRGLAGTGKTIVLSLKAAISHKRFDDFKILYLFNTQSLYGTVSSLITKYYSSEAKRPPDFDNKVHIFHAWGGRSKPGLYSELCRIYGLAPLNFTQVRGASDSLKYIYKDLLKKIGDQLEPIYDLVLIDEAQDFPEEVFEVVFKITKGEGPRKKIVWAYDEFQSLKEAQIKEPADLFGKTNGVPNLENNSLNGEYAGGIKKDFILPNCYRTPRPVLMVAHGVAMGLYSKPNYMFYSKKEWESIGYSLLKPNSLTIQPNENVELERQESSSRNILEKLLIESGRNPKELIQFTEYSSEEDEISEVANSVKQLIDSEGVKPEEIIIVNLKNTRNKESMLNIQQRLNELGIKSVIPGYVESSDVFRPKGYITLTTPFRAKGNEANIVFVVNAQFAASDFTLRARNAFFVAVTRSRGWCYISGNGNRAQDISQEFNKIIETFPKFLFKCPPEEVVASSRRLISKSDKELDELQRAMNTILENEDLKNYFLEAVKRGKD